MQLLAQSSGTVVYQKDNQLFICRKPYRWLATFIFVTAILTFIFLTNGLLQFFVFKKEAGSISIHGMILLIAGILSGFICWRAVLYKKKINAIPPTELKIICIVDMNIRAILAANQSVLAFIDDVRLGRKMQFGSSSPQLILIWQRQVLPIVNGNPFSGGITAVEQLLISKGIRKN